MPAVQWKLVVTPRKLQESNPVKHALQREAIDRRAYEECLADSEVQPGRTSLNHPRFRKSVVRMRLQLLSEIIAAITSVMPLSVLVEWDSSIRKRRRASGNVEKRGRFAESI